VVAFRLFFPISELVIEPSMRKSSRWKNVIFIEAAPSPLMSVLTLFICTGEVNLKHKSQPSFCLAKFNIGNNQTVQLIAHAENEGNIPIMIENALLHLLNQLKSKNITIPINAYSYLFGQHEDGCRFIVGAKIKR
jgi:hypothetical protein